VHGPVRQRIVDLIANRPDGITRSEIIATVYADDINGGPDNPNTISVLIKRAMRNWQRKDSALSRHGSAPALAIGW
jgi:hypothetical protein